MLPPSLMVFSSVRKDWEFGWIGYRLACWQKCYCLKTTSNQPSWLNLLPKSILFIQFKYFFSGWDYISNFNLVMTEPSSQVQPDGYWNICENLPERCGFGWLCCPQQVLCTFQQTKFALTLYIAYICGVLLFSVGFCLKCWVGHHSMHLTSLNLVRRKIPSVPYFYA